jgi:hypothetical protein
MSVAVANEPCSAATPDCRFWDWGESNLRPDCCTEHLLELVDFAHALLTANGIVHWLDFGTLLGAVRDGSLIPWDWDADFGILARDAEAVLALRGEIEAAGHSVDLGEPAAIRLYYSEANRISLDLWMWHERGELLVSEHENPLILWPGMHDRSSFPAAFVDELSEVELDGRRLPAPRPAERLLAEHRYGPDWRTPIRPIVSLRNRPVVPAAEMTDAARELLPRIAERDAVLRGLLWNRRTGRLWQLRPVRWLVRAGLPLDPPDPDANEPDPAHERVRRSLAWTEQAIAELENPTPALAAKKWSRRASRLARRLV